MGMFTRRANFAGWAIATVISIGASLYVQHFTEIHWSFYYLLSVAIGLGIGYPASLVYGFATRANIADRTLTYWGRRGCADYAGSDGPDACGPDAAAVLTEETGVESK